MKIINKSFVFDKIPSKPSSHSVSLCKINDNEIIAFWFAGSWEGEKDVDILSSRYDINADKWDTPKLFIHDPSRSLGNTAPVLFEKTFRVYYCAMEGKDWTESSLWYTDSYDQGYSWTEPKPFSLQGENLLFGTKILKLSDNRFIFPMYNEKLWISTPYITNNISSNKWEKIGEIKTEKGNIQQDMVEMNGQIFSLLRTRDGFIYKTLYNFENKKWSTPISINIPNPNSRLALEKTRDLLICCCNPLGLNKENLTHDPRKLSDIEEGFWGKREKLSIFVSSDGGNTWNEEIILEESQDKEYSYPWIQIIDETKIMIAYTYERQKIAYAIIEI